MREGAVSIKQWDGAHLDHGLIFNQILGRSSTGGMPTGLWVVDVYHFHARSVANDQTQTNFSKLQTILKRKQHRLLPNNLSHIQVPIRFVKHGVDHQTGELSEVSSQPPRLFRQ